MITSSQKIMQSLSCSGPQEYLPVAPLIAAAAGVLCGIKPAEFLNNASAMSQSLLKAQERFGLDAVYVFGGAATEAEAMGTTLDYDVEGYPVIQSYCVAAPSEIPDLPVPDPGCAGRLPVLLEAISRIRETLGDDVPVIGLAVGPLTIAHHLMPIDELLFLAIDDRPLFESILQSTTRVTTSVALAMAEAGAAGVILGDFASSPSVIPNSLFQQSILPRHREIVEGVREKSPVKLGMHVPDARISRLSLIRELAPDWIDADETVEMPDVRAVIPEVALFGNIRPYLFVKGSREEMEAAVRPAVDAARQYGGVVLGSASEVPLDFNPAIMDTMVSIARSYHNET